MTLRQQLPVYSPISLSSLLAGLGACVSAGGQRARAAVSAKIAAEFALAPAPAPRPHLRHLLLTDSGTSALTLAIRAACDRHGRRLVALPAYCCYDVATAADGADVEVVLYDIDPGTLGPDLGSLKAALARRPAAVVFAHLYGVPIDIDALRSLVASDEVTVIEDAAQGHGAGCRGRALGGFGSLSVLSFGRGKGVTGGSGGALLANDESGMALLSDARSRLESGSRGCGSLVGAAAQWLLGRPALYGIPASLPFLRLGETIYKPPHPPAEMCDSAVAVLEATWPLASREAELRMANGRRWLEAVSQLEGIRTPALASHGVAGYLRFPVVVEESLRDTFASATARRHGIMPGYPTSLADLTGFAHRCLGAGDDRHADDDYAGARLLARRLFTLPTHGMLGERDMRGIAEWLRAAARTA